MSEIDLPLCERLLRLESGQSTDTGKIIHKKRKLQRGAGLEGLPAVSSSTKKSKNEPVIQKSNRPVPRFRNSVEVVDVKFRDPRFSDICGKLNPEKFRQSFGFLEQHQEEEIRAMENALKKVKAPEAAAQLNENIKKAIQEQEARRRNDKVRAKLSAVKHEEREKVARGKKPFYLKKSSIKQFELEEKFEELKKSGKLSSYLMKKRRKNGAKDKRSLPFTRPSVAGTKVNE